MAGSMRGRPRIFHASCGKSGMPSYGGRLARWTTSRHFPHQEFWSGTLSINHYVLAHVVVSYAYTLRNLHSNVERSDIYTAYSRCSRSAETASIVSSLVHG